MLRLISDTPAHVRSSVQLSVAAELMKKDAAAAAQLLDEARTSLAKRDSPRGFGPYLLLTRLYAAIKRQDAIPALSDAVKAMNQAERAGQAGGAPNAEEQIPLLSNDMLVGRYALAPALLEMDDAGVRQIITAADSPARRAAMRLGLLRGSLERFHAAATPKSSAERKAPGHATP